VVAVFLEELAGRYFDWQEACPVMRPGSVPPDPPDPGRAGSSPAGGPPAGGELIQARLQLASAARTVLAAGLRLLGIAAPSRM
jgi:DALR anticodon binding domain